MVTIGIRVLHRPDVEHLPFIYQRLGTDYDERILPSIINEVAKAVVARFNASDLITKRDAVSMQIRKELEDRAR
jgi:regulator of protease activity HflC (stomatin/prohibitin superfamily)